MGCGKGLRPLMKFFGFGKKEKKRKKSPDSSQQHTDKNYNTLNGRKNRKRTSHSKNWSDSRDFGGTYRHSGMNEKDPKITTAADDDAARPFMSAATCESLAEQKLVVCPENRSCKDISNGILVERKTEVSAEVEKAEDTKDRSASASEVFHEVNVSLSPVPSITIGEVNGDLGNQFSEQKTYWHGDRVEKPSTPKINFQLGEGDEDNDDVFERPQDYKKRRHKVCRGIRLNKSSDIVVKYTKVYGENDGAYKNDSAPRGLVFMVNFTNYDGNKHLEREGSTKDFHNMLSLFQKMGYETSYRTEKYCHTGYITKEKFLKTLKDFSQEKKHNMLCSCIVVIMSHGSGPKTFITSDNQEVDLMEVYAMLNNINCPYLHGKPKIFILQFCRNSVRSLPSTQYVWPSVDQNLLRNLIREEVQHVLEEQYGIDMKQKWRAGDPVLDIDVRSPRFLTLLENNENISVSSFNADMDQSNPQNSEDPSYLGHSCGEEESSDAMSVKTYQTDTRHLPTPPPLEGVQRFSDMYSIFSTASGELSHRDPRKGSLLIQAICHVFAEYAYQDEIDTLVRKVSMYMSKTLQKDDPIHVPRQTCERTNNGLDKYFYFNPEYVPQCRHVTI